MKKKKIDYVEITYSEKEKPFTDYPNKLAKYLFKKNNMSQDEKILELVCGRGEFINAFINQGLDGYGLDSSESSKKKFPNIKLNITNLDKDSKLPYEDSKFDYIFSKSFIEHFYDADFIFEEAYRILKPNGILISLTPDWEDNFKIFYDDHTHKRPYTLKSLKYIHTNHNFKIKEIKKFKQLPSTWNKNILIRYLFFFLSEATKFLTPSKLKNKSKWIRFSKEIMLMSIATKN